MRVLALDVGDKRIGLAMSDPLGITAQGLPTHNRVSFRKDIAAIQALMREMGVARLVVGWPRNMDGTAGKQAEKSRAFGDALAAAAGVPVEYWDERLTSKQATRALIEGDVSRKDRKGLVDRLAASMILSSWLDAQSIHTGNAQPREREGSKMEPNDDALVDIVELEDEEGTIVRFRHEMTMEHNGDLYAFVVPVDGLEELEDKDEEESMVILKIVPGEGDENDTYEGVEDERLLEELYNLYLDALDDEDDYDD